MGFRLTALPEAMRDFGVEVVEVAGCYGRGPAYPRPPIMGVDHWTVGAARGEAPSLAICTYGRPDLRGPLCGVLRGRRTNGRIRAFFVADGISNNAGRGSWPTTSGRTATGNADTFGLEVEYRPYAEPIRDEDLDVDARIHAAAAQVCGYTPADVAGHWEYATPHGRKVDRKTIAGHRLRGLVAAHSTSQPTVEEDHMDWSSMLAAMLRHRKRRTDLTGKEWGIVAWWSDVIAKKNPTDRYGAYVWILHNEPAFQ